MGDMAQHLGLLGIQQATPEQVCCHLDRRQGVAQVVADDADHLLGKQRAVLGRGMNDAQLALGDVQGTPGFQVFGQVLFGKHARVEQRPLVARAAFGPEQRQFMKDATVVLATDGAEHHRQGVAIMVHQVEFDIDHRALDLQQRQPVGLVKGARIQAHQALNGAAQQFVAVIADPAAEGQVDPLDLTVFGGQQ
ncbi:hypothetical protein D3C81_989760 [compost metagenome]